MELATNAWEFLRLLFGRPEVWIASALIILWQAFLLVVFGKGSW